MTTEDFILVKAGGIEFPLWRSRILSVEHVRDMPRADVFEAYRSIANDDRPVTALDPEAVTLAVQGWVDRSHFIRVQKTRPPASIQTALNRFLSIATSLDRRGIYPRTNAPKIKRTSQIGIALEALKAGLSTEQVIDAICREHPTSKANRLTVANYRRQLRAAGKLPQFKTRGRRR